MQVIGTTHLGVLAMYADHAACQSTPEGLRTPSAWELCVRLVLESTADQSSQAMGVRQNAHKRKRLQNMLT
jgi:hypothetical protein